MKPGRNYANGRAFEYRVKSLLEDKGWFVVRSAGSHGLVDLVLFTGGKPKFIQCKRRGVISPADRTSLRTLAEVYGAEPLMVCSPKRGQLAWYALDTEPPIKLEGWP